MQRGNKVKKLLFLFILLSSPVFSAEKVQLSPQTDYIYFSDINIKDVKSSDNNVVKAKPIVSYSGNNSQMFLSAISSGKATVDINTEKGIVSYEIEVNKHSKNSHKSFVEIDIPSSMQKEN